MSLFYGSHTFGWKSTARRLTALCQHKDLSSELTYLALNFQIIRRIMLPFDFTCCKATYQSLRTTAAY
jgi:hypothetical protein